MSRLFATFAVVLLATSGCTVTRSMKIGTPAPVLAALPTSQALPWQLGEVHVTVEGMSSTGVLASQSTGVDYAPYKQQLTDRLKASLLSQQPLGATLSGAGYALEVDVKAREVYGLGKQMWLSLLLEGLVFAAGMGTGLAIDAATTPPNQVPNLTGFLVGSAASVPLALLAASLPESGGCAGTFEAKLILRRLSDRVPVSERRVESTWRGDYNWYGVPEKLAVASGAGVTLFEKELLTAVSEMLQESQPSTPAP
jgi:hypothetical protein